jgi:hypothetical protein
MNGSNGVVSLEVTGPNGDLFPTITGIPWQQGLNVQQELEAAYNQTSQPTPVFHFYLEYFGSYGYMVSQFSAIADQDPNYWMFYVNGVLAQTGIDSYALQAGDAVQWKYQSWSDAEHAQVPVLQAKRARALARADAG